MLEIDIGIVGGGMVGLSFARAIADSGFKCVLIDKQDKAVLYQPELDNRGLALSRSSIQILKNLQLWDKLAQQDHGIKTVHVTEKGRFGFSKLSAKEYGLDALGYVVSAHAIGTALSDGIEQLENLTIFRPETIKTLCLNNKTKCWEVALTNHTISAKLLVAADGTHSYLRQRQNIDVKTFDYEQEAIVTNVYLKQSHVNIAYERFTQEGPLALLPFGENKVKCVWTVGKNFAKELLAQSNTEFLRTIQQAFGSKLGQFVSCDKRIAFPLKQVQALSIVGQRMVLLGNAANTMHPVAAQGYNLGLRDVAALAEVLTDAKRQAEDFGSDAVLDRYAKWRKPDHDATLTFTHQLSQIFEHSAFWLRAIRQAGLLTSHFIKPIKNRIAYQGMGTNIRLPKLARES